MHNSNQNFSYLLLFQYLKRLKVINGISNFYKFSKLFDGYFRFKSSLLNIVLELFRIYFSENLLDLSCHLLLRESSIYIYSLTYELKDFDMRKMLKILKQL